VQAIRCVVNPDKLRHLNTDELAGRAGSYHSQAVHMIS